MATMQTKWVDVGVRPVYGPVFIYGYQFGNSTGDMSNTQNGTTDRGINSVYSGSNVNNLYFVSSSAGSTSLQVTGQQANSGWSSISIGGSSLNRADATFSSSAAISTWSWPGLTNRFGTTAGVDKQIIFDDGAATPTFSVAASPTTINEGAGTTFTLTTSGVANGVTLGYTITGISAADLASGSLTGSFSISNNSASTTISLLADATTEGQETATLTLASTDSTGASTGSDTAAVIINDTSTAGGGGGGGGGGSGNLPSGSGNYGLKIYGPNGSTVVIDPSLRVFNIISGGKVTLSANSFTDVTGITDASDPTKVAVNIYKETYIGSASLNFERNPAGTSNTIRFENTSTIALTYIYQIYRIG